MKRNFFTAITAWLLFGCLALLAQSAKAQGIQRDAQGNYHAATREKAATIATFESLTKDATKTGATFTTAKGEKFSVWLSKNKAAFVVRTSKNGTVYRQYMPK
jgi:hypothetical protein